MGALLATVLLFAPVEEAVKAGTLWPVRSRFLRDGRQGAVLGATLSVGFALVEMGLYWKAHAWGHLALVRALLGVTARALCGRRGATRWEHAPGAVS